MSSDNVSRARLNEQNGSERASKRVCCSHPLRVISLIPIYMSSRVHQNKKKRETHINTHINPDAYIKISKLRGWEWEWRREAEPKKNQITCIFAIPNCRIRQCVLCLMHASICCHTLHCVLVCAFTVYLTHIQIASVTSGQNLICYMFDTFFLIANWTMRKLNCI